jgi:hypothetical protein
LLLQLGEAEQARRMYLLNREETIQRELRKLKMEGSTELFVAVLASKYFGLLRAGLITFSHISLLVSIQRSSTFSPGKTTSGNHLGRCIELGNCSPPMLSNQNPDACEENPTRYFMIMFHFHT